MRTSQENFHKKLLGKIGENNAVKFLKSKGYKILDRNYKTHIGEIDIVAKDKDTIVFCEVKTRSSRAFGEPAEAVNKIKQNKYFKVAQEYLIYHKLDDVNCRFDIVEVIEKEINHIENAFYM